MLEMRHTIEFSRVKSWKIEGEDRKVGMGRKREGTMIFR